MYIDVQKYECVGVWSEVSLLEGGNFFDKPSFDENGRVSCAKTKKDTFEILCWVNYFEVQCLIILESAAFASTSSVRGVFIFPFLQKKSLRAFSLVFTYFSGKLSMLQIFLRNFRFCVERDLVLGEFGRFIWNFRFYLFIGCFVDHLCCSFHQTGFLHIFNQRGSVTQFPCFW